MKNQFIAFLGVVSLILGANRVLADNNQCFDKIGGTILVSSIVKTEGLELKGKSLFKGDVVVSDSTGHAYEQGRVFSESDEANKFLSRTTEQWVNFAHFCSENVGNKLISIVSSTPLLVKVSKLEFSQSHSGGASPNNPIVVKPSANQVVVGHDSFEVYTYVSRQKGKNDSLGNYLPKCQIGNAGSTSKLPACNFTEICSELDPRKLCQ